MATIRISLNTIEKVKNFSRIVSGIDCDMDIISEGNRYIIDAKSIMGIFSLDLSKNLNLVVHSEDKDFIKTVEEAVAEFKVA